MDASVSNSWVPAAELELDTCNDGGGSQCKGYESYESTNQGRSVKQIKARTEDVCVCVLLHSHYSAASTDLH